MHTSIKIGFLLLFSFSILTVAGQVNLTNGLVANYSFSGNANDISGNGHHGILVNGPTLTNDRFGNSNSAYFFDGIDDYIRVNDNGAFSTSQISISLWFKTNSDALQNLVGKRKFNDDGTQAGGAQYQFFINYTPFPGIGSNLVGNNNSCNTVSSSSYINTADIICKSKWYHAVITFDGTSHKIYIDGVLKLSSNTGFNSMLSCLSELRFGAWWTGGTLPYSGIMDDIRWYNRPLNQQEVTALFDNFPTSSSADFGYNQSACDPKTIQFNNLTTGTTSIFWDFGNNTTNSSSQNPSVTYLNYANYTVKLRVQTSSGCKDSVTKVIPVDLLQDSLVVMSDTTICRGNSIQLNTLPSLEPCWESAPGLSSTNISNPIANPQSTTTYYFTSKSSGNNLVINSNFSTGNTAFLSDYVSNFPNTAAGQYWIGTDPATWQNTYASCGDHTSGNGNMMMVNGSSSIGAKIWEQTIAITPNTNYAFSAWIKSLQSTNPANLRFSINGSSIGNNIIANSTTCIWNQFYATWNSGTSTTATIKILNNSNASSGNDFAIDDISFAQVFLKQDSIKITVTDPPVIVVTPDTSICPGESIALSATGAGNFSWSPSTGLSNPASSNPIASPTVTTKFIVTGYDIPGCISKDSVTITFKQRPVVDTRSDTAICAGTQTPLTSTASGATSYSWFPTSGLSDPSVLSPLASPILQTKYILTVSNGACVAKDSVTLDVKTSPVVSKSNDTTICHEGQAQLFASGGTGYVWSPSTGLNNPGIPNPIASPIAATRYYVTVTGSNNCSKTDSINVGWLPKPVFSITPASVSVCEGDSTTLTASGATSYNWFAGANIQTPAASSTVIRPLASQQYSVAVTHSVCGISDTLHSVITVSDPPVIDVTPDLSLCAGESVPLNATGAANFTWSPAGGLSNTGIANPLATPAVTTKYIVTGFDQPGCSGKDSVIVTVKQSPVITATNDTSFCVGSDPIVLSASAPGGVQYSWSPANGLSDPTSSNPSANPAATQKYYVEVTGTNGCKSTDSVNVAVLDVPVVDTRSDTSICNGFQTMLNTTSTGASMFSWFPSIGLSDPSILSPLASPSVLTKYILTVSNGACTAKDSVIIDVKPSPVITKSNDTAICNEGSAQLFAGGGVGYNWSPSAGLNNANIPNPVASPNAATKYFVTVTGSNACSKTDSINVGWQPKPTFSITPLSIAVCAGESTMLSASGADIYNWYGGDNIQTPAASSTVIRPLASQQYSVAVTHSFCDISDTLQSMITVNDLPVVTVSKSNDIDCSNASATLSATGGVNYSWTPSNNISAVNTANPVVTPAETTTYYVNVTNAAGCRARDSVRVLVVFNPISGGYNMPNAFTPNNDGKNDCFGIKYWGIVQNLNFAIYNRWGERIFVAYNDQTCWDGNYKGIPQPSGTYVYQIKATTACGDVFKKGTVVLMR